jgi:phage recombination protein Bet
MSQLLTTTTERITFTDEQVTLIKKQIAPKATIDELQLFLYQAKRTGLDPLTRQIYCIHRYDKNQGSKMTIQTSIDGFRVIAERSGDYGGQDEPEFLNDENGNLLCCKVRVYKFRGDIRYQAAVGVAYWSEYVPQSGQDHMWKKMPHTMLSKVAEALALRKAYPQDLSGLYTNDEMQQSNNVPQEPEIITTDIDELHAEYISLYNEYVIFSNDPEATKLHPDNWKKEQNAENYKKAIEAIKKRLNGFPGYTNGSAK